MLLKQHKESWLVELAAFTEVTNAFAKSSK
jgi:hypothetical protein